MDKCDIFFSQQGGEFKEVIKYLQTSGYLAATTSIKSELSFSLCVAQLLARSLQCSISDTILDDDAAV